MDMNSPSSWKKRGQDSCHACSVEDVAFLLEHIPAADYGDLHWIIFRQSKCKEKILSSIWGSLVYSYRFEHSYTPAVLLEACDLSGKVRRSRCLMIDHQKEFERLHQDGHDPRGGSVFWNAGATPKAVRIAAALCASQ
jgi:hypothetical protein